MGQTALECNAIWKKYCLSKVRNLQHSRWTMFKRLINYKLIIICWKLNCKWRIIILKVLEYSEI